MMRVWTLLIGVVCASNDADFIREIDMGYDDDVSLESTAAAVVETLGGSTRKSFWILQSTKKNNRVGPPPGLCVFGSGDSGIDGWYKLIRNISGTWAFQLESSRESMRVFRAQNKGENWNWYLVDLGNTNTTVDDVAFFVAPQEENSNLPPFTRDKWFFLEATVLSSFYTIPFVLPADDGYSCRLVRKNSFYQILETLVGERSLGSILPIFFGGFALITTILLKLWIRRRRRDPGGGGAQQQRAAEWPRMFVENRHDNLGEPPHPNLDRIVFPEAEEVDEEEEGDDEGDDVQQPLSLVDVRDALGRGMRWIFQTIKTLIVQYLLTADVTKPLLALVLTLSLILMSLPDFFSSTEKLLRKAQLEGKNLEEGMQLFLSSCFLFLVVATVDMYRRSMVLLFKFTCAIGLGNLRDAEVALLRSKCVEEFATSAAICVVSVLEMPATLKGVGEDPVFRLAAAAGVVVGCTIFSGLNLLACVARSRLAHLVSTPEEDNFWGRAWQHVRLFSMLMSIQTCITVVNAVVVFDAYNAGGTLAALQMVALAVQASKQVTQAFAHHIAFACFELGPSLREMKSRLWIFVFGGRRRRRRHRRSDEKFYVTTYYVELAADIAELSLVMIWYAIELLTGAAFFRASGALFCTFALQAQSRLRARIAFHQTWREARSALINANEIFTQATQEDIDENDDVCVICMEDFRLDEDDSSRRPLKLQCNHILHKGCLQQYINTGHRRTNYLQCMICHASLVERPAPAAE